MDTTVTAIGDVVVATLEDAGYMQSTIGQFRKSIKWLGVLAKKQDGVYTRGLGAEFASMMTSPRTGRTAPSAIPITAGWCGYLTRTCLPAPWIFP